MTGPRFAAVVRVVALALLVAACAALPAERVGLYVDAFAEARVAGEAMYRQIDVDILAARGSAAGDPRQACLRPPDPPSCFVPRRHADEDVRDPDVRARLAAFETVAAYNDALVALASGASAARVGETFDRLAGTAQRLVMAVPVGQPATSLLAPLGVAAARDLLTTVETARANVAARASIVEQADTVRALIDLLIDDTPTVYDIFRTSRSQGARQLRAAGAPLEVQRAELARATAFHQALDAYVALLDRTGDGFDALAASAAGRGVADLEAAVDQALAIRAAGQRFADALAAALT